MDQYKKNKEQFRAFIVLSIIMVIEAMLLNIYNPLIFRKYFGNISPFIVLAVSVIIGFCLFLFFNKDNLFSIHSSKFKQGFGFAFLTASAFFIPVVLFDLEIPFPDYINTSVQESIMFYSTIAFFIETVFHLLPLIILYNAVKILNIKSKQNYILMICIITAAFTEPVFQNSLFDETVSASLKNYVFIYIYLMNLASLLIFKKYDFMSMYFLRFFYYVFSNIVWGALRAGII